MADTEDREARDKIRGALRNSYMFQLMNFRDFKKYLLLLAHISDNSVVTCSEFAVLNFKIIALGTGSLKILSHSAISLSYIL